MIIELSRPTMLCTPLSALSHHPKRDSDSLNFDSPTIDSHLFINISIISHVKRFLSIQRNNKLKSVRNGIKISKLNYHFKLYAIQMENLNFKFLFKERKLFDFFWFMLFFIFFIFHQFLLIFF